MGRRSSELSLCSKELIVQASFRTPNKAELSRMFNVPRTTISSILKKFEEEGTVETKPRSGRRVLFTARDTTAAVRLVKKERKATLADITAKLNQEKDQTFCQKTVVRKLHQEGYRRRLAKKKMVVRLVNKRKRVVWCQERRHWKTDEQWKTMIFSDESQVVIGTDNRVYLWRKDCEVDSPHLVCTLSKRKVSLMVWGCITYEGMGTLVPVEGNINGQKYINIIDNNLWPVIARHFPENNYVFQDDNAPVHRARVVKAYMEENDINCTEWPAQSPDLNIIENVWLRIKRDLQKVVLTITNRDQLFTEIHRIWQNLPIEYVRQLYDSIPARVREVIRMKGNLTKY
jgi:transposase